MTREEVGQREIEFAEEKLHLPGGAHKGFQEASAVLNKGFQSGYMQVLNCSGSHRYFVAETFAVEGEGTVGAIIICTACGESKLITHKVARGGSSVSLKEK